MVGLSYKQKCNNFGYHSNEVQSKGNDKCGEILKIIKVGLIEHYYNLIYKLTLSCYLQNE